MQAAGQSMLRQIISQVESANEIRALRVLHDRMPDVARDWQRSGFDACEILSFINQWHDQLIKRTIELTLADLESAGRGAPPTPFCWLLLGSGGRREQTLAPDQDNALLYLEEPSDTRGETRAFFQMLAEWVVSRLAAVGYPYCPGFVMATNPRWNGSLREWRQAIGSYAGYPDGNNARFLAMAADMRPICGDFRLAAELREWFSGQVRELAFVHWQTAQHGWQQPVALDWRDRFRTEKWGDHMGELNIKEGGYLQIVNAARLWSLAHGVHATSTLERIAALRDLAIWEEQWASRVAGALRLFIHHRIWGNYVCPDRLSDTEAAALKEAMRTARHLQKRTARRFRKPK
ncbi:DUF294 nucleotidyltransferase-like domain-containing protein [Effusibacillus pohliae]|uniref:DUF294 nucleotidyltransferase-like domain-containing protein n=1 Tax=Effusibacillus pohliae TaxID=232270 RepID=UPI00036BDB9F|nr:DUF294 nucleotidyltransferase-like domain-containing protein [Effusibacillus pohliae]